MGDPRLSLWLRRAHRRVPHALGKNKMGADPARRTCIFVSLDLGASGEMREPLLGSAEQNRLVEELSQALTCVCLALGGRASGRWFASLVFDRELRVTHLSQEAVDMPMSLDLSTSCRTGR